MKIKFLQIFLLLIFMLVGQISFSQSDDQQILNSILLRYYKTEKPVYKGRSQLLYFYCNRANNNEELIEAIQDRKLSKEFMQQIRIKIKTDIADSDWSEELSKIFETDKTKLNTKINDCMTLEKYQEISKRLNLNNQRLMIVNKPLYDQQNNIALVKVVFYRNIEHNSGSVLLLEKENGEWLIKEYLNPWST